MQIQGMEEYKDTEQLQKNCPVKLDTCVYTLLLLFVMSNCDFVTFICGILGQVLYLIVLIHDLCRLSYLTGL